MKNKFTLRLFSLFTAVLFSVQINAQAAASGDKEITLNQTVSYGTKVVQVSFNGDDSDTGSFTIKNAEGVIVKQIDTVELVKAPYYFTVDVSGFSAGDYTFSVKTTKQTYTSSISIK